MKKLEKDLTYDVCIVNACKCIHVLTSLGCSQGSMSKSSFLKDTTCVSVCSRLSGKYPCQRPHGTKEFLLRETQCLGMIKMQTAKLHINNVHCR